MQGGGIDKTIIAYGDHQLTTTSATFTSYPSNIIITGITFKVRLFIYISTALEYHVLEIKLDRQTYY